jgi:arginyl-tRNA synthetase
MFSSLTEKAKKALKSLSETEPNVVWTMPQETNFGDISTNVALQIAKAAKKQPREIAQMLCDALAKDADVEKAEVAGAGYVNVWLKPEALLRELRETRGAQKPATKRVKEGPVVIDYSAPNIAKPLGIHHILSTVIGQSLANLYRHLGYTVVGINHLGDWGTQFGKLAVAHKRWGTKSLEQTTLDDLLALYVKFHDEAEKNPELENEGREAFRKIEQGDKELYAFWKSVVAITMKELEKLYARLHVSFDHVHGESFYQDKMAPILAEGKKKKVFVEGKEGALIVEFAESTNLTPAVVVKGDDATIYMTRDLATARYRIDTFHPQALLYVVDVAQEYYFRQLFETLRMLGWELPHMEHVMFGRMSFKDRKMSTRKGNILRLEEVLDEAVSRAEKIIEERGDAIQTDDPKDLAEIMGIGAVIYGVLSQNRKMNMVFDWDKMLSFDGNSAPYLQYTHARARSVLRKGDVKGEATFPKNVEALTNNERSLISTLLQFPAVLEDARENNMPHKIANYLYELCQGFNAFYNVDPILTAEGSSKDLRIALTAFCADVLRAGASILTMRVPDRM